MKLPGISLSTMMYAVAILAADFAVLTHLELLEVFADDRDWVLIGLLPMANVLALSLPRLVWLGLDRCFRRALEKPFAIGFQATSWVASFVALVMGMTQFQVVEELISHVCPYFFSIWHEGSLHRPADRAADGTDGTVLERADGMDGR